MTVGEVKLVTDAYVEKQEQDAKRDKINTYNNAYLTALCVCSMLSGKTPPTYESAFGEKTLITDKTHKQKQQAMLKEKLLDFAENANKQRRKK